MRSLFFNIIQDCVPCWLRRVIWLPMGLYQPRCFVRPSKLVSSAPFNWFYDNQLQFPQAPGPTSMYCRRFSVTTTKADVHRLSVILATAASKLKYRTGGPEEQRRESPQLFFYSESLFESGQGACWTWGTMYVWVDLCTTPSISILDMVGYYWILHHTVVTRFLPTVHRRVFSRIVNGLTSEPQDQTDQGGLWHADNSYWLS